NMDNENVPAPAHIRSDDQILPFAAWNFFRAFIALASVPAIYLQRFWGTLMFEAKTRAYRFQLDENYFRLDANLLREALDITPVDQAHQFVSPPSDYAELMWEEFVQAIQTFLVDNANLGSPTKKGKKTKPYVIPYSRFTKLIIYHLGRHHNIHQRSRSPLNLAEDDLSLGNLKFIPKGKIDEVFGIKTLEKLITDNIRNAPYYNVYLGIVAKHEQGIMAVKKGGKIKTTHKADKLVKPAPAKQAKPATAKQPKPKPVKEKPTKATPLQKAGKGEEQDQPEAVPEPQGAGEEYDLERAIQRKATRPILMVEGKGKAIVTEEQAAQSLLALHTPKRRSTTDQFIFQRQTPATEEASTGPSAQPQDDTYTNIVCETPSPTNVETGVDADKVISEGDTK
nr:E-beta-farnesene synthase [Tanacetum cinerariifolium]